MTNGTSQGLFIVIAIIIFGLFIFVSYLLFNDNLKPSLSGIFNDSLEQSTDNLSGVTNPKYLNFSTTNGNGINGLTSNAYNEDGSIKKNLKTLILPNTINSRDLVTIDFTNSNITGTSTSRFAGVEKIVGNSKLTKVTPILTYTEVKELDLSQTQVTDIGQSFLKDNKTVKKLTLGKQFSNFGYAPFQNSALEELTLTNITPITNLSQGLLNLPSKKITLNAPKELEEQLRSYESRFKKVNYY